MSGALTRYDAACRALAEARSVDEVKLIHDEARALAACARIAKNRDLEADAVALRMRATRQLDHMIRAQKESVGLNTGTAGKGRPVLGGFSENPPKTDERPTLASQGIDKSLAHQAHTLNAPRFAKPSAPLGHQSSRTERRTIEPPHPGGCEALAAGSRRDTYVG